MSYYVDKGAQRRCHYYIFKLTATPSDTQAAADVPDECLGLDSDRVLGS